MDKSLVREKFGENVIILIIVVELQNAWRKKFGDLVKFAKLFSHQTFVLYSILVVYLSIKVLYYLLCAAKLFVNKH